MRHSGCYGNGLGQLVELGQSMGVRSKIKLVLCSPCIMLISARSKMEKYRSVAESHPRRTVAILIILLVFCLFYVLTTWCLLGDFLCISLSRHAADSGTPNSPIDKSFLRLYSGAVGPKNQKSRTQKDSDLFVKSSFLDVKLQRLIALTYLSTPLSASDNIPGANFTYLLNELNIALKVDNFYRRRWGCQEISSISMPKSVQKTRHTISGDVLYKGKNVALQTSLADLDEMMSGKCGSTDSDKTKDNENRCFLLKSRRLLQQYLFLQELSHPNIVKFYGVCLDVTSKPGPASLVLAKEAGLVVNINKLQEQSWNLRLKIAMDLASLAVYLGNSPLGPTMLENWQPSNFIITQDGTSILIKLTNFDQNIIFSEHECNYHSDCSIADVPSMLTCKLGICENYLDKSNVYNLYKSFLSVLLEDEVPDHATAQAKDLFGQVKNLKCTSSALLKLLQDLQSATKENVSSSQNEVGNSQLREALKNHHDGAQVDSWEQHESHVAINEVDVGQLQIEEIVKDENVVVMNKNENSEDEYKDTFGYKKIENADYPGRYDYYCPRSKAEWGCVASLRKLEDAAKKCDGDPKCKAFVTMPHLRKEGWIIVILKSDNTRAVDHAGTTVYIKAPEKDEEKSSKSSKDAAKEPGVAKICFQDLLHTQEAIRENRMDHLMGVCDWAGMSDAKWQSVVLEASVSDATKFKPSRGKMAVGGQMDVTLDSSSRPAPALFLAKNGPDEFHLAQLAAYHLDRMLGLYKILPAFLRTLTETEMADAGFPVDVGGNQFDVFRHLKNADKSLAGTIVPMTRGRTGVEHYISVPKLAQITNAVTPFSNRQWDDLEYLLLMWLASLPMPNKGHKSLHGHLIHIKADEAFQSEPSKEVLSYFYNCQFPRIAVDVLRTLRSAHCNFGDQLIASVQSVYPDLPVSAFSFKVPMADIATRNANRLLEVVDMCVKKFGDNKVLYDS